MTLFGTGRVRRRAAPPRLLRVSGALLAAGFGTLTYASLVERQWFALRRASVPVLPPGARPVRVLHLSDLHMLPRQRRKARWVSALADLHPDLVIMTGDALSSMDAVPAAVAAFGRLLDVPGGFVFGNNDFYAPEPRSPHRYFTRRTHVRREVDLPWEDLRAALVERGWADLNNRRATVTTRGLRIALAGLNDPHTRRDRYDAIAGPADPASVVRLGVVHSPEPRLLDRFAADGYDVVLAGHTHGGQVRLPLVGAVVTNCGVDRSRARGLSRWGSTMWLNVSAGLGTSPYAPVRLLCRPEATLLTLLPVPAAGR